MMLQAHTDPPPSRPTEQDDRRVVIATPKIKSRERLSHNPRTKSNDFSSLKQAANNKNQKQRAPQPQPKDQIQRLLQPEASGQQQKSKAESASATTQGPNPTTSPA